jgi:hypothetical protein
MTNWPLFLTPATRASLIANLTELYAQGREQRCPIAERISETLADYPSLDMLEPDVVRARLNELIR